MDEPLPNVSTSSDLSDEEDSNLAGPDIKEEPVEIVPNITAGVRGSGGLRVVGPGERQSYSSGQEDPNTDSDTVSEAGMECDQSVNSLLQEVSHALKCSPHINFEQLGPSQGQVLNLSGMRHPRGHGQEEILQPLISCHICGLKLPNQTIFQQVRLDCSW